VENKNMIEKLSPLNEKQKNEELLQEADYVINALWKKVMDTDGLPLSVDSDYQVWIEDLQKRKESFARILFKNARESKGEEKLYFAKTLNRLINLLNVSEQQELFKKLMTTKEAIKKLVHDTEQEVANKQSKLDHFKDKIKKRIDRVLFKDDDFMDRLK
jgi:hypothetical protein